MDPKSPRDIAMEILLRNIDAVVVEKNDYLKLETDIADAIQAERDQQLVNRVQTIDVLAGDAIFIGCGRPISDQAYKLLSENFGNILPGIKVVFMEESMQIKHVVRTKDVNEPG